MGCGCRVGGRRYFTGVSTSTLIFLKGRNRGYSFKKNAHKHGLETAGLCFWLAETKLAEKEKDPPGACWRRRKIPAAPSLARKTQTQERPKVLRGAGGGGGGGKEKIRVGFSQGNQPALFSGRCWSWKLCSFPVWWRTTLGEIRRPLDGE